MLIRARRVYTRYAAGAKNRDSNTGGGRGSTIFKVYRRGHCRRRFLAETITSDWLAITGAGYTRLFVGPYEYR